MKFPVRFFSAAPLLLLMPVAVAAQPAPVPNSFGVDDLQVVTLSHLAFVPQNSTQTYFSVCCVTSYRYPTSGFASFYVPIDASLVPNGARIEEINFYVEDSTAAVNADFGGYLCRSWTELDGTGSTGDCPVNAVTTGSPGDTVVTLTPDLTVEYESDADADGAPDSVSYMLVARFGLNGFLEFSSSMKLRGARILFRRQISPAPQTPTFGDVLPGDPLFQFVEALAASGITVGCGSGNYCPESPLTRGQMAVFLAKALGLHWPAP